MTEEAKLRAWFARRLVKWHEQGNSRDFPWREGADAYQLLMSEMMLRRTQARQVAPVYRRFLNRWPTLSDFLKAREDELREVLEPLGLKWRASNFIQLQTALKAQGSMPENMEGLVALPGVGDYVANAVLCFSGYSSGALIDTNTVRVIARFFGLETHDGTRRLKWFKDLANNLLPIPSRRQAYHYALLDLAATVCTPVSPCCEKCPLHSRCAFFQKGRQDLGPEI